MKTSAIIADDEGLLRLFLSMLLEELGIEIRFQAQNGNQAISAVGDYSPDAAFLDINMDTKEDGLDACAAINERYPDVKVFFVSAYPQNIFEGRLESLKFNGFIEKPVNKDSMRDFLLENNLISLN